MGMDHSLPISGKQKLHSRNLWKEFDNMEDHHVLAAPHAVALHHVNAGSSAQGFRVSRSQGTRNSHAGLFSPKPKKRSKEQEEHVEQEEKEEEEQEEDMRLLSCCAQAPFINYQSGL